MTAKFKSFLLPCLILCVFSISGVAQNLQSESVVFQNGEIQLSGTLFLPPLKKNLPAVVILHGSGPDEGLEYKIYAEEFGKAGIATLVFDKRGSGKSSGDWRKRPFSLMAGDALAAVAFLQNRPEINPRQIGLWGISQGGWTCAFAAAQSKEVAFVISVAGNAVSPAQQEIWHKENMYQALGYAEKTRDTARKFWRVIFDWLVLVDDGEFPLPDGVLEGERPGGSIGMNYDPLPDWEKITQPVLLIHGEDDKLSPAGESISRISAALTKSGNANLTYKIFPKSSHTITVNKTGLEFDWDKHFAADYFKFTTDWILANTNQETAAPIGDNLGLKPSPDFDDSGDFGKTAWYQGAYFQLFLFIAFPFIFLICFIVSVVSFFRNKNLPSILAGILCLLNLVLIIGFFVFLANSIFPQGLNLTESYSIPTWQKFLPFLGAINLILTVFLMVVLFINKQIITKWQILISIFSLLFIPWLYYWNLIGSSF